MTVTVTPTPLRGSVAAIPSKSDVHRLLICAALADRETVIVCPAVSEDIMATARCLKALGAKIRYENGGFLVEPIVPSPSPLLDCGESGSTLRFLLPVAAAIADNPSFIGRGRLPERPIGELLDAMRNNGVTASSPQPPLTLSGRLESGEYILPGNVSSQYVTGLLLALPTLTGGGKITLTSPLESASYVDMTLYSMSRFGVSAEKNATGWSISGQRYISPGNAVADGDWSNAAFFIAADFIGGGVTVTGLRCDSVQGDRAIVRSLKKLYRGESVDLRDTPDMLPALAAAAAFTGGGVFTGAKRLRMKESDRLNAVTELINALGGKARETEDGVIVEPVPLRGGTVKSFGDHRIVMTACVAGAYAENPVTVLGAEAVNKSYPGFFKDFVSLGGVIDVV